MKVFQCDRCGKQDNATTTNRFNKRKHSANVNLTKVDRIINDEEEPLYHTISEICEECTEAFRKFMNPPKEV